MGIKSNIVELSRDASAFGAAAAIRNFGRKFTKDVYELSLPVFGNIFIRNKDSDYNTVVQTFRNCEYKVNYSAVQDRLNAQYQAILDAGKRPLIIDCGANIGVASIWFASIYPQAAVVAVEPDPGNVVMLRKNLAHRPNMTIAPMAIGAQPGFVSLVNDSQSWGIQTERAEQGCEVTTIPQIAASVENSQLFLVKIDIEGFEEDLFSDSLSWIDHAYGVFIEPHDWLRPGDHTSRNFQKVMAKHDFEIFILGENLLYVRSSAVLPNALTSGTSHG